MAEPWCHADFDHHCTQDEGLTAHHLRYPATTIEDVLVVCRVAHGRMDGGKR